MIKGISINDLFDFIEQLLMKLLIFLCKFRNDFLKRGTDECMRHDTPLLSYFS